MEGQEERKLTHVLRLASASFTSRSSSLERISSLLVETCGGEGAEAKPGLAKQLLRGIVTSYLEPSFPEKQWKNQVLEVICSVAKPVIPPTILNEIAPLAALALTSEFISREPSPETRSRITALLISLLRLARPPADYDSPLPAWTEQAMSLLASNLDALASTPLSKPSRGSALRGAMSQLQNFHSTATPALQELYTRQIAAAKSESEESSGSSSSGTGNSDKPGASVLFWLGLFSLDPLEETTLAALPSLAVIFCATLDRVGADPCLDLFGPVLRLLPMTDWMLVQTALLKAFRRSGASPDGHMATCLCRALRQRGCV
jgi:hypothetical protein